MFNDLTRLQKQALSVLFTFAVYAYYMNWKVSLLIIAAVGFHECCHIWAANYKGLPTGGFYMIPFMGGVATVTSRYRSYAQQAFVVLAGPVGGGLMGTLAALCFYWTKSPLLGAAAAWITFLNLFNLLPFSFMDGGQIVQTITFSINNTFGLFTKIVSTVIGGITLWFLNPVISIMIMIFGGTEVFKDYNYWKARNDHKSEYYYRAKLELATRPKPLSLSQILVTTTCYLTAIFLLVSQLIWLHAFDVGSLSTIR